MTPDTLRGNVPDAHPCAHALRLATLYPGLPISVRRLSPDRRQQPRQPIPPQGQQPLRSLQAAHRPAQVGHSLIARCRAWLVSRPWSRRARLVLYPHQDSR